MDIRQALKTLEHSPEWVDRYIEFLASTTEPPEGTGERHHILPRALFPEFRRFKDHPWNLIRLNPADHLVAHYYLYRAIPSTRTRFAFRLMVGTRAMSTIEQSFDEAVVREVATTYAEARASMCHTPETRTKLSAARTSQHIRYKSEGGDYAFMPRGDSHHRRILGISEETKAKISAGLTGKTQSAATVEARRLKLIGQRKPWSSEARSRRSLAMQGIRPTNGLSFKGCKHTQATRDKMSAAHVALNADPTHKAAVDAARPRGEAHWTYGTPRDESTRSKISASLTGKSASEDTKAKMSETRARKAFEAITQPEHRLLEQALTMEEPQRLALRAGMKASERFYALVTGLNTILMGRATEDSRRYWAPADRWLQFTGREELRPRST